MHNTSLAPIKVVDIELSQSIPTIENLEGYIALKALVRLHGVPLGYVQAPIECGCCTAQTLSKLILEQHSWTIVCQLAKNGLLATQRPEELRLEELVEIAPAPYHGEWPLVTVAVCTRDRPDDMKLCLEALSRLDYPHLDILVVDNAPQTEATKELVETYHPQVRYVREPRPGLDWARNRAILEAKGEIIAYTDDDVIVDPGWVKALAQVFAENAEVMAVTGLVVPYELETEAQLLFETYGGFGRGFEQKWYQFDVSQPYKAATLYGTAGMFGTGANMAYRRRLFNQIGSFDPALDVGTVTNGGGDIEMFFRLLKEGHILVYEPNAMVRHRHRRDYEKLRSQIANNGVGLFAYFVRSGIAYPDERLAFLKLGISWFRWWLIPRLLNSFKYPQRFPKDLVWGEFWGSFIGLTRYQNAKRKAAELAQIFAQEPQINTSSQISKPVPTSQSSSSQNSIGIWTVELSKPLTPIENVIEFQFVRVFVLWLDQPIGSVDIHNYYQAISQTRLAQAIAKEFGTRLLELNHELSDEIRASEALLKIAKYYCPAALETAQSEQLPADIPVSIALATFDRPNDLRNCLKCLLAQESPRPIEIIVVDNHPASGLTPPVVAEFPTVKLVREPRKGLAYARNAAFIASTGDIVIATDDDVTIPPDWVEKLVAPFARPDVMIVTGNVLPIELETPSQQAFESYGGLGRGYEPFEVNGHWFESFTNKAVPTWELGATANAAFRATMFNHPEMGLMEESLGPGMPSGVGEDTYLFYKALKAGYTLVYQPQAYVWHKHRQDMAALRRQLYNYSKGGPSYHLVTLMRDRDLRGLWRVIAEIPSLFLWRVQARLRGWTNYPMRLLLLELIGNLAGPWSLWQSIRRVKREGKSDPYIPVVQRSQALEKQGF
jgi:O-antigen biosynthesis protein